MMKRTTCLLMAVVLISSVITTIAAAGGGSGKRETAKAITMPDPVVETTRRYTPPQDFQLPSMNPNLVGTLTTLRGYYDYQANGTPSYIRVNPATGAIHVIYMVADDSVNYTTSRSTAYAMSTNGGATWNNFTQLRVPPAPPAGRRSGFPSIDLLQGASPGVLIANHNVLTSTLGNQSLLYIDSPEGSGSFAEISAPPDGSPSFGTDQPIWPFVAGASDGSVVMHASRSTGGTNYWTRTTDFVTWSPWTQFPLPNGSGGRNPLVATGTGRVGTLVNATGPAVGNTDGGAYLFESTNNGQTWGSAITVHPHLRYVGPGDPFAVWVSTDMTYDGNNALVALSTSTYDTVGLGYFYDSARVDFWSQATGLVTAAPHDTLLFANDMNNHGQTNHLTVGGCTIAKSGTEIVIVFEGFHRDTAANGFRMCDLWGVKSTNGGLTWTRPTNITRTPGVDERFPSLSKYNGPGFVNLVWQEELQPGAYAPTTPDAGALPSVNWQKFWRMPTSILVGVNEEAASMPTSFTLEQNFPNPFNPATKIGYTVQKAGLVTLKVYNVLGEEVATLLNQELQPGSYQAVFDATRMASGVYYYKMTAGSFTETKKMMLVK